MIERGFEITIIVVNHTPLDEDSPGSFPSIGCFSMISGIRADPSRRGSGSRKNPRFAVWSDRMSSSEKIPEAHSSGHLLLLGAV